VLSAAVDRVKVSFTVCDRPGATVKQRSVQPTDVRFISAPDV
jgi:hypothetical protein